VWKTTSWCCRYGAAGLDGSTCCRTYGNFTADRIGIVMYRKRHVSSKGQMASRPELMGSGLTTVGQQRYCRYSAAPFPNDPRQLPPCPTTALVVRDKLQAAIRVGKEMTYLAELVQLWARGQRVRRCSSLEQSVHRPRCAGPDSRDTVTASKAVVRRTRRYEVESERTCRRGCAKRRRGLVRAGAIEMAEAARHLRAHIWTNLSGFDG